MAALERYFLTKGKKVAGYDRTPTDLTRALEAEGVETDKSCCSLNMSIYQQSLWLLTLGFVWS